MRSASLRPGSAFAALLVLAALSPAACSSMRGTRPVDYGDRDNLATSIYYECAAKHIFLVEEASPIEVRVTDAPTCVSMGNKPFIMDYSLRLPDGDHFFLWDEDSDYAGEFIVPLDRRRDAELRRFDPEPMPRRYTLVKGERGVVRIEGEPSQRWTCWSHAPGAEALREASPP